MVVLTKPRTEYGLRWTIDTERETVRITDHATEHTDGDIPVAVMPITVNEIIPRAQKKGLIGETDMQAP